VNEPQVASHLGWIIQGLKWTASVIMEKLKPALLLFKVELLDERSSNSNISSLNRGEAQTVAVKIVNP
jgi:hypothetical protein